jgi:2-deoxy-D-gluconate 3-dehydrogenase
MTQTDMFSLVGRTALVTSANTGIGQGMAIALAAAGADIVAVGRTAPEDTAGLVRAASAAFTASKRTWLQPRIRLRSCSRPSSTSVQSISSSTMPVSSGAMTLSIYRERLGCRDERQPEVGGGKIINIASMLSFQGGVRVVSYTASKSGIAGMTRLLANEWAAKGINVNAIAPGYIATNNTAALRNDETRNREILGRIPAGRWGKPDDLAGAVVFLASRASDYMHGTVIPVDGGWLAR